MPAGAALDGIADSIPLHDSLIAGSLDLTPEVRFKTETGGVLWGYQGDPYPVQSGEHVSLLYIGTDGKLHGDVYGAGHVRLASAGKVNDGRWHHAALSVGGGRVSLYLDGTLAESKEGRINHLRMTKNQLGNGLTSDHPATNQNWFPFAGLLGEVRAWHAVRTGEQIKQNANRKIIGDERALVAYYPPTSPRRPSINPRSDETPRRQRCGGHMRRQRTIETIGDGAKRSYYHSQCHIMSLCHVCFANGYVFFVAGWIA